MKIFGLALLLALCSVVAGAQTKTIAITIDDLPYATMQGSNEDVIQARRDIRSMTDVLREHKVPFIAFVNEAKLQYANQLDMRVALLDLWLDGGAVLGNHTYSHKDFNHTPVPEFEAEVIRGEVISRRLMQERKLDYKYFRHPFLRTGATLEDKNAFEAFLKQHGYTVAPVTAENVDWFFNTSYQEALKDNDYELGNRVLAAYLAHTDVEMDYYEKMTRSLFGRDIAHVMLLHSNRVNAIALDEVLSKLEARGYKFVTLDEALKDPAYQTADNYVGPYGYPWQHRWALTLGKNPDFQNAPDPPKFVQDLYKKATAAQ
jgi:peptidoglycan/xylan/chitin deacetylase (PgdA/CDA1 family)